MTNYLKYTTLACLALVALILTALWAAPDATAMGERQSKADAKGQISVGQPAPAFTAQTAADKTVSLSDFQGKYVVLEWHNPECPFVKKHYNSNNMQTLQQTWTDKDVVWLTIRSSAVGKEGYADAGTALELMERVGGSPTHIIMDASGEIGHLYQAKTTPQMVVIGPDEAQSILYYGAIDSLASTDPADVKKATNFVAAALESAMAGKPVAVTYQGPYGCSVKY